MTTTAERMRAYKLQRFDGLAGLQPARDERPVPTRGEVLVRVRASSLNFRDLALAMGWAPFAVRPGVIPLSDAAGEVVALGPGVSRFAVGDRVVSTFWADWFGGPRSPTHRQYGTVEDGWLSEYKAVPAEALVRIPPQLSFAEAATLPCAGVTAWSALAGVGPGDTVLTQGSGGVALFALQLARAAGARVIATTTTAANVPRLRALGASDVIDTKATPEWAAAVRELTAGRGADRIVDIGGPGTLAQSAKAVAYGGQVSLVGALGQGGPIDFMGLFMSQARYETIAIGSRADLEALLRVVALHELRPVIDRSFELDDAPAAWAYFAERRIFGKVVIEHGEEKR
jgi:NADPH:quinone reductase-like Zn-dependent oxidoreductase